MRGIGAASQVFAQGLMQYGATLRDEEKEKKREQSLLAMAETRREHEYKLEAKRYANNMTQADSEFANRKSLSDADNATRKEIATANNKSREKTSTNSARPVVYSTSKEGVDSKALNDTNTAIVKAYNDRMTGFEKTRSEISKSMLTEDEKNSALEKVNKRAQKFTFDYRKQNEKNTKVLASIGNNPAPLPTSWKNMAAFDKQFPKVADKPVAEKVAYMTRNNLTLEEWPDGIDGPSDDTPSINPSAEAYALAQGSPQANQQAGGGRRATAQKQRRQQRAKGQLSPQQRTEMVDAYRQALQGLQNASGERNKAQSMKVLENLQEKMEAMGFTQDEIAAITFESQPVNLSARPQGGPPQS